MACAVRRMLCRHGMAGSFLHSGSGVLTPLSVRQRLGHDHCTPFQEARCVASMITIRAICLVLLSLLLSSAGISAENQRRDVKVLIRVDDVFMASSRIVPVEIDSFLRIAEKHGARVVLATVPNRLRQSTNQDGQMTSAVREAVARGHEIVQHGFDHKCVFTGATGREFATSESLEKMTQDQRIAKILEGRRLLEAVTSRPVTGYVGPGEDDHIVLARDLGRLRSEGYTWLADAQGRFPVVQDGKGSFPPRMEEFTWQLSEENYASSMELARKSFSEATAKGDEWEVLFHDHFTRKGYLNGITLRWFDELLTWIEAQPGIRVRYVTLNDLYEESLAGRPKPH